MTFKYLVANVAAVHLNISRTRFFYYRRFVFDFPKPIKVRLNSFRPRLVCTPNQLDAFAVAFWGGRSHD